MKLAVSQDEFQESIEERNKMEVLQSRIKEKENEIYELEKEIEILDARYKELCSSIVITFILLAVVIAIFVYIATNAAMIVYRFITQTYFFLIIAAAVVGFIAYVIRRAAKEIPMYLHCKQEEKGTSKHAENYVYRAAQKRRKLADCRRELEETKQSLNELC